MFQHVIKVNGFYDILCALCILEYIHVPLLGTLHCSMVKKCVTKNMIYKRLLAHFIIMNGFIRIFGDKNSIIVTYFIESLYYSHEILYSTVHFDKAMFVVMSSLLLGICA